ncbi:hypothetical protein C9374_014177 [Naegleria lovaniensis]|uniref:TRAF3-interacting protein 1 N-terminal domain-containing protein n=1 Tax=Naegleria lovaniensis TaxID=51637 RepID=A0AA88GVE1_NAELO|nr:uncharacterized protein C9374_014177 [Naegleria lovaniensis]KAG2389617.1 hypothetical protein C9374_014177 [Naegleria lovaniensis]
MSEQQQQSEFDEETRKCIEISKKKLEPLVSKIPLQDKHLARPPVAFIKALVLCLIKERGYPDGLFDEEFLKAKKDLTNEEKTLFLKQLINVIVHTVKKNVPVNIQLMIKGKETPKNISVFFQALAEAAGNKEKYQYKEAIEKIKSGKYKDFTEASDDKKKKEAAGQQQNTSTPPSSTQSDSSGAATTNKQPQKSTTSSQQPQQPPPQQQQPKQPSPSNTPTNVESKPQQQQGSSNSPSLNQDQGRPSSRGVSASQNVTNKPPTPSKEERSTTPNSIEQKASISRPNSGREISKPSTPNTTAQEDQQQPLNNQEDPNLAQYSRPFSSRGQSARRAPPKIKTNVRTIDTQEMPTEKTQVETKAAEGLITDDTEDKEEEQIIIEKNVAVRSAPQNNTNAEQKGTLVNRLMENESDIEKKRNAGKTPNAKPSSEEPVKGIVLQTGKKEKDKEVLTTELSTLREQIQTLISKVNPLGKTMDYIQEDLDSMQREHDMWRKDVELQRQRLIEERMKTEQEVSSVQAQLKELEQNIVDKLEKINSLKSTILQNDKLLETLLRNVVA